MRLPALRQLTLAGPGRRGRSSGPDPGLGWTTRTRSPPSSPPACRGACFPMSCVVWSGSDMWGKKAVRKVVASSAWFCICFRSAESDAVRLATELYRFQNCWHGVSCAAEHALLSFSAHQGMRWTDVHHLSRKHGLGSGSYLQRPKHAVLCAPKSIPR